MNKVYCNIRGVLKALENVGAILDVEYLPDPQHPWDEVRTFCKKGKFALKFEGHEGVVTLRNVTVSTATSLTEKPGMMVALGQNDPRRIIVGAAQEHGTGNSSARSSKLQTVATFFGENLP